MDELTIQIGPKEIYDKLQEVSYKVDNIGPRLDAAERKADQAHDIATLANRRSIENRRVLLWAGSVVGTLALVVGGAWLNKHIW